MYLRGIGTMGDDENWGVSYGDSLPAGWDTIPASMPQAGTGLDQYIGLASQALTVYSNISTAQAQAETAQALAARGLVPQGYVRSSPAAAQNPAYGYSPFQRAGAAAGTFSPAMLLILAGLGVAAYLAFSSK